MRSDQHLDAIARESAVLADAAERAGLDASVPSCPPWTVRDLVTHIGGVQRWATTVVTTRPTEPLVRTEPTDLPPPDGLVAWFRAASAGLVDALGAAGPDVPVWTFLPGGTTAFWFRRQAHEVAVHRVDAEQAGGVAAPIATDLAADGIAEWLEIVTRRGADVLRGDGETVHLHCTDTREGEGEWLVTLTPDGPRIEATHAKGDVAARGTASDLELVLWGRGDVAGLEVFGDAALLERLLAAGRV